MTGGRANGRVPDHGTDMNSSAEKASRKWANCAFGRSTAAMVTVAAVALTLGMQAEPAAARRSAVTPWGDLFGGGPLRLRGTVHRLVIPLPRPPPAEAPNAARDRP